ncbi:SDR family NAD(P)-dependent oxidoreductase [Saccharopolyspora sp. HNM0983]|uniref:SDR family NAD(P)-dependent oxidoreductase n=1 Tax=Saccharopolyspora montiporae TaxID=2781240 RepID=A0A929B8L2_9PSEU|nr:oxidoreductase [Saccharopolyspora sp. HNM0983]MBE9373188.1 SDR family NAD(P)-dependent oxidoreductase [Saccharopolyspora sp. HNM0983]
MTSWSTSDIPDQTGRAVLITGANSGLGKYTARILAERGARVLLACRDTARGEQARDEVADVAPIRPELVELDLADLKSVRRAAADVRERTGDALDVLINNAGVMFVPHRSTADGFELQTGTNHLGHAALTWLLMPALTTRPAARVVTVSSIAHRGHGLDAEDLDFKRRTYNPMRAYSQSKLANLLFAQQLQRAADAAGADLRSIAAHPGMTSTNLTANSSKMLGLPRAVDAVVALGTRAVTQPVEQGALPQLFAATAPGARGGDYIGPSGFREIHGAPKRASMIPAARDEQLARRLWEVTAEKTGVDPAPQA